MKKVSLWTAIWVGGALGPFAEELPETVITAGRVAETRGEVLYSVDTIPGREFLEQGYRTIPEALANTPGVSVQKTTHGHGSPFIRGFTGRQNLLLVDGIRINNSTYRGGPVQYWNTVDGFGASQLELVKSQGSVLYGSDALGGTLNVLSGRSWFEEQEEGFFLNGSTFYRFDTNSESHLGRVETRFGEGGKWGVVMGGTLKGFGDIRDSALGLLRKTGYDEENFDFKLEGFVTRDLRVTLAHQYVNQDDVWRWHRTKFNSIPWNGTTLGEYDSEIYDQERSLTYLRAEGEPMGAAVDRWSATFSFQKSQDSTYQDRSPADLRTGVIDVETYGLDVQGESSAGNGRLVYGVDYYHDRIDAEGTRTGRDPRTRRPVADDSTYHLGGLFGQYRWDVGERAEVAVGARYTHAEVKLGRLWDSDTASDISASDSWDALTLNFRGQYAVCDGWDLFGGASQGFRAPNVNDLSGNLTSRSGVTSLGALDLEPEKTWTFELGSRVANDRWSGQATTFFTLVDDLITGVPESVGSDVEITTNAQEAEIYGVELEGLYRINPAWAFSAFVTWQQGTSETPSDLSPTGVIESQWVSRLSPLRGSVALRYQPEGAAWWVEGRVTAAEKADKLSAGDKGDTQRIPPGGTPGYVVASLNGGWQVNESVLLTLGLENLTDENYRIHGSGVNQPGVGAIVGVKVDW